MTSAKVGRWTPAWTLGLVLFFATLVRGVVAARLDLSPDEAYYWTWSQQWLLGYFDHPPMVAWLIGISTTLFGHNELAVRLPALLLSVVSVWALFRITERLVEDAKVAMWVALLACSTPLMAVGSIIHTPDAALSAAWAWALVFAMDAMRKNRWRDWLGLGLALGLGLLAKASAWLLLPGLGLFALTSKAGRDRLMGVGPVLAVFVALLLAAPNLWWELGHGGQSLGFQWAHVFGELRFRPLGTLDFLGAQAGVISPLIFVACIVFWFTGWRRGVRFGRPEAYLLWCTSGPWVIGFLLLSSLQRVEANWPAPVYLAALPGLAWALLGGGTYLRRRKLWMSLALGLSLVTTLIVHAHALSPFLPLPADRDPTARLRGWEELSIQAVADADALGVCLASEGYGPVSELAFYSQRPVAYEPNSTRRSQFDLQPEQDRCSGWLILQPVTSQHEPRRCQGNQERFRLSPRDSRFVWWVCGHAEEAKP